jgi:multisubunit Na+/H+ antiporter MnhC subunit
MSGVLKYTFLLQFGRLVNWLVLATQYMLLRQIVGVGLLQASSHIYILIFSALAQDNIPIVPNVKKLNNS